MTTKYEFDAARWARNWSARKRFYLADGRDPFALVADEVERLRELREAIAWERECNQLDLWYGLYDIYCRNGQSHCDAVQNDFCAIVRAARAEVDRLLGEK